METVTWAQVLGWRMRRQFLDPPVGGEPVEVARRLAGVQAQVASAAELTIAARQAGPRRGAVAEALADGTLVKTWAMRGTLHLLPADEASAYLEVSAAHRNWESASWQSWFAAIGDELAEVDVEGQRRVMLASQVEELVASEPSETVRLLGAFDAYVLGTGTTADRVMPCVGPHGFGYRSFWPGPWSDGAFRESPTPMVVREW